MTKHKHHDTIVAWAADTSKVVQYLRQDGEWIDCRFNDPAWNSGGEYRIKSEPKPDVVELWKVYADSMTRCKLSLNANLRLTFDGETGKLKAAEVLA